MRGRLGLVAAAITLVALSGGGASARAEARPLHVLFVGSQNAAASVLGRGFADLAATAD